MFSSSELSIRTIGCESQYVFEKLEVAIYKKREADIFLAKGLLGSYQENLKILKKEIDQSYIYDHAYFDHEFKTIFDTVEKLIQALDYIDKEEYELQANILHNQICSQDHVIRKAIEKYENQES